MKRKYFNIFIGNINHTDTLPIFLPFFFKHFHLTEFFFSIQMYVNINHFKNKLTHNLSKRSFHMYFLSYIHEYFFFSFVYFLFFLNDSFGSLFSYFLPFVTSYIHCYAQLNLISLPLLFFLRFSRLALWATKLF